LFTFLTTLLLLLGVSCAIIIRSLILRRRFRRRVQEAIANGVLVPGLMTEPMPRELGEKPKMWNVWIGNPETSVGTSVAAKKEDVTEAPIPMPDSLANVLPISATKANAAGSLQKGSMRFPPSGRMPSHAGIYGTPRNSSLLSRIWPRRPPPPTEASVTPSTLEAQTQTGSESQQQSSNSSTNVTTNTTTPSTSDTKQPAQVSLLIAMPSAARSRYEAYISQVNSLKSGISTPQVQIEAPKPDVVQEKAADAKDGPSDPLTESASTTDVNPNADTEKEPNPHRLSESSTTKGKARDDHAHLHPHNHGEGVWGHLEEGEIPYMEFGVLEVVVREPKAAGDQPTAATSAPGSTSVPRSGATSPTPAGTAGGAGTPSR